MWLKTAFRDVLLPLVGLGVLLHEVLATPEPRYLAVVVGLVLLGIPADAAIRVLAGWRGLPPSDGPPRLPPPGPSPPSSSSGPSAGGSSHGTERIVDAA